MGRQERSAEAHVLILPYPLQGHINPMLQFSKRLVSKGLKVTIISSSSVAKSLQSPQHNVETIFDGSKQGEKDSNPNTNEYLRRYNATVPHSLSKLIEKYGNSPNPVKCVIYDSVLPWVFDVVRGFGIYGASFFTQSCAVNALYYSALQGELKEGHVVSPEMEFDDLPSFINGPGSYPAIYDVILGQFYKIDEVDWLFLNTFNDLEDEIVNWMASKWAIKPIGPTIPSMFMDKRLEDDKDYGLSLFKPNSEACMKWLDAKEENSVIYVSFGSLAALGEYQMAQLASGLKASKKYFLWVVRDLEETKLPQNFKEETQKTGLIVHWCPQLQVLAHKSVCCFITHCGWNSTLEALSLGVPMVGMPQWTDQPTNAKFVSDVWEVGVRVKKDENGIVTKDEIERCISEVMDGENGEKMRRSCEKWKKLAKMAVDEGGSSDRNIEEFVEKLNCMQFLR